LELKLIKHFYLIISKIVSKSLRHVGAGDLPGDGDLQYYECDEMLEGNNLQYSYTRVNVVLLILDSGFVTF